MASAEAGTDLSPEARQAALLINRLRMEAGLSPLAVHPLLNLAVNRHIQDMVTTGHYGHSGSDGSNVHQRVARTGYDVDGWAGENWAVSDDVATSIRWWMDDLPHRQNVLNLSYQEMGLGTYPHPRGWGLILVVDFTTGSTNQAPGVAITPNQADAPLPEVAVASAQPTSLQDGAPYTIQEGDTLFSIGQRFGMPWQTLASANGLGEFSVLQVGSQIVLPGVAAAEPAPPVQQAPAAAPAQAPHADVIEQEGANGGEAYTVAPGDTLFDIAMRHNVDWQVLAAYNNLPSNDVLQIGVQLKIPNAVGGSAGLSQAPARRHIVQEGETLWSIAAAYEVDWYQLMAVNNFNENSVLSIGQEIQLP